MCQTVFTTQYGNEQNKVSTTGRVVLCRFWIHAVSNFSSPSAQETAIPAAASKPILLGSYFLLPLPKWWHYWCMQPTPGSSYLLYTALLTYSKKFEQEGDWVARNLNMWGGGGVRDKVQKFLQNASHGPLSVCALWTRAAGFFEAKNVYTSWTPPVWQPVSPYPKSMYPSYWPTSDLHFSRLEPCNTP